MQKGIELNSLLELYESFVKEKTCLNFPSFSDSEIQNRINNYLGKKSNFASREEMVRFICGEVESYLK